MVPASFNLSSRNSTPRVERVGGPAIASIRLSRVLQSPSLNEKPPLSDAVRGKRGCSTTRLAAFPGCELQLIGWAVTSGTGSPFHHRIPSLVVSRFPSRQRSLLMSSARMPRVTIGRMVLACLAALTLLPGLGCSRLNLWEGPSYRDDPVVSEAGTSPLTAPPSHGSQPSRQEAHPETMDEVKTSRANR